MLLSHSFHTNTLREYIIKHTCKLVAHNSAMRASSTLLTHVLRHESTTVTVSQIYY